MIHSRDTFFFCQILAFRGKVKLQFSHILKYNVPGIKEYFTKRKCSANLLIVRIKNNSNNNSFGHYYFKYKQNKKDFSAFGFLFLFK